MTAIKLEIELEIEDIENIPDSVLALIKQIALEHDLVEWHTVYQETTTLRAFEYPTSDESPKTETLWIEVSAVYEVIQEVVKITLSLERPSGIFKYITGQNFVFLASDQHEARSHAHNVFILISNHLKRREKVDWKDLITYLDKVLFK